MKKLILGPPGLGKTTKIIEQAIAADAKTMFLVPSHKLGKEIVETITGRYGATAQQILGRTQTIDFMGSPLPVCPKRELVQELYDAGVKHIQSHMCILFEPGEKHPIAHCEFSRSCEYGQQFLNDAQFKIYTHNYITQGENFFEAQSDWVPDLVVADEDPLPRFVDYKAYDIGYLLGQSGLVEDLTKIILAQPDNFLEAITEKYALPAEMLQDVLMQNPDYGPGTVPGDSDDAARRAISNWKRPAFPRALFEQLEAALRFDSGTCNNIWLSPDKSQHKKVHVGWMTEPKRLIEAKALALLDATPNVTAWKHVIPDLEVIDIPVEDPSRVIQIFDSTVSRTRLEGKGKVSDDIAGAIIAASKIYDSVGVCASKAFLLQHEDTFGFKVKAANFGNLRGLNYMRDCDALFIVGRNEPSAFEVERIARSIWPYEKLDLPGNFVEAPIGYQGTDGLGVMVRVHPDERVQSVLAQIRDGETEQAKGRLRGLRADKPKHVYVLTNVPGDWRVDQLVELDDITGPRGLAMRVIQFGGALPLNGAWLHSKFHGQGEFKSEQAAKVWGYRCIKNVTTHLLHFSINTLYEKCNNSTDSDPNHRFFQIRSYKTPLLRKTQKAICWRMSDNEVSEALSKAHGGDEIQLDPYPPGDLPFERYQDENGHWHASEPAVVTKVEGRTARKRVYVRVPMGKKKPV